jgi:hypothetical protein
MSRAHEAFTLPLLFLTVALIGGVRITDHVALVPPPLFALVLAFLFIAVLARSGALAPERLMNQSRSPLANLSGLAVLLTLFAATTQAFNTAIPESGLPRVLFSIFLLVLLFNTLAADPDRVRVLRSAMVIFGCAFTLKYVVLGALSDPSGGRMTRLLQVLFEGVTLGTVTQQVYRPVTGYIAFAALALFVGGVALLPPRVFRSEDRALARTDSNAI